MLTTWKKVLPITLSLAFIPPSFAHNPPLKFASAEHVVIGNNINLHFSNNDAGQMGVPLTLPNGVKLTYGDLISMGDFYGAPEEKPISQGKSDEERKLLFKQAFYAFASNPTIIPELNKIMDVVRAEQLAVETGLNNNETPEEIYKKIGHEFDRTLNCITGGGCDANVWWMSPGRYLRLVYMNYDHFGDDAILTYKVGHEIALEMAANAHQKQDTKKLELAYAINAFASHFLTDRFASGHIRTPRVELSEQLSSSQISALLANYMHEEENLLGLHVHNKNGDNWIAYGDKSYFSTQSENHRKMINTAVQESADEVFAAYKLGTKYIHDKTIDLIPEPDELQNASLIDISPLFYWDNDTHKLMRRQDMTNYYDKHWTDNWWGWTTLIELARERGISNSAQAMLLQSKFAEKAMQSGLITNKDFISYYEKNKKKN